MNEGKSRNNLANTLIMLERFGDARLELQRAIDCKLRCGHAAEPWITWNLLHDLDLAGGSKDAAAEARGKSIDAYRDYRRNGGGSYELPAQLCADIAGAIAKGEQFAVAEQLKKIVASVNDPRLKAFISALLAILDGSRDPALYLDPDLHYSQAVELELLLEQLGKVRTE